MYMRRIQRYHVLSIFGDMKLHKYTDAVMIGSLHISNPANRMEIWPGQKIDRRSYVSDVFEGLLKQLINDGLLHLVENDNTRKIKLQQCEHSIHPTTTGLICVVYQVSPRDYDIQITIRGRECLGLEQIARSGDYSFYKNFDGTTDSAQKINPSLFKNS